MIRESRANEGSVRNSDALTERPISMISQTLWPMTGPRRETMADKHFRLGVFMPVGNNGWILSKTAPQYMPTFELNRNTAQLAEKIGFDYVFSMAKWTGYGGATHFWDYSVESFTLMSALAPVTTNLRLVASVAPILIHPAIVAKMAATLDDISGGRL